MFILSSIFGETIINWFSNPGEDPIEHIKSEYLSLYFELLSSLLSWVFEQLSNIFFNYFFDISFDSISKLGTNILNKLFDKFTNMDPSFAGITFYVGFIFFIFVVKKAIDIIRG